MDEEAVVYIYNGILLSHKKECIWVNSNEVDEPRADYTDWGKSERGKQILYTNAYMWSLEKWYGWTYVLGRNREASVENGHTDTAGKGNMTNQEVRVWHTYTIVCKANSQGEPAVQNKALSTGSAAQGSVMP